MKRAQAVEYWLRYAIFFFAIIRAILLLPPPEQKNIFKNQKSRRGEKEAGEKETEPSDKVETYDKADGETTHDGSQNVK